MEQWWERYWDCLIEPGLYGYGLQRWVNAIPGAVAAASTTTTNSNNNGGGGSSISSSSSSSSSAQQPHFMPLVHAIRSEDMRSDPDGVFAALFRFLGLPNEDVASKMRASTANAHTSSSKCRELIKRVCCW